MLKSQPQGTQDNMQKTAFCHFFPSTTNTIQHATLVNMSSAVTSITSISIGLVDNDACALEYITALVQHITAQKADVWHHTQPAYAIQRYRQQKYDIEILIIDMALNGVSGIQVANIIRGSNSHIRLIGMTAYDLSTYKQSCINAEFQCLLDKSTIHHTLRPALQSVLDGHKYPRNSEYLDVQDITKLSVDSVKQSNAIPTKTERIIISLSLAGRSVKEIATMLRISEDTVYSHRRNINHKFNTRNWIETLRVSQQNNIF